MRTKMRLKQWFEAKSNGAVSNGAVKGHLFQNAWQHQSAKETWQAVEKLLEYGYESQASALLERFTDALLNAVREIEPRVVDSVLLRNVQNDKEQLERFQQMRSNHETFFRRNSSYSPLERQQIEQQLSGLKRMAHRLRLITMSETEARKQRMIDGLKWMLTLLFLLVGLVLLVKLVFPSVRVTASGEHPDGISSPKHLCDGDPKTEWKIPHAEDGWASMKLRSAQVIKEISVQNGINAPYNDRSAKDIKLMLYTHGKWVQTIQGSFEHRVPGEKKSFKVNSQEPISEIRVEVWGHHNNGASLAEIVWK